MGELVSKFTYPRNAFRKTADESASEMLRMLDRVDIGSLKTDSSGKGKDEAFLDGKAFLGICAGTYKSDPRVTAVGQRFRELSELSPVGAWRWLVTRALWLYSTPNGTDSDSNKIAAKLGLQFNFFDMIMRQLVHLSAKPYPYNAMYFDEILYVLDEDMNWSCDEHQAYCNLMDARATLAIGEFSDHKSLLGDLEPEYGIKKDNWNGIFRKALVQTGMVDPVWSERKLIGVTLNPSTYENPVIAERLRFILDNPRSFS